MVPEQITYKRLAKRISKLTTARELHATLEKLEEARSKGEIEQVDYYNLIAEAFWSLPELKWENITDEAETILDQLLRTCLADHEDARVPLGRCREAISRWISEMPSPFQREIRERAIQEISKYLKTGVSDPRPGCWTLSHIGYRSDIAVEALWEVINQRADEAGDTSLAVLTGLGMPNSERGAILNEFLSRVSRRYSRSLATALSHLADPEATESAIENWLESNNELKTIEASVIMSAIGRAFDKLSDNHRFQDRTWSKLDRAIGETPNKLLSPLALGNVAPSCNSPHVVSTLLERMGAGDPDSDPVWFRYLLGLRLENCVIPRQLVGWEKPVSHTTVSVLEAAAKQDSGIDVMSHTQETYSKEMAWKTLLRAGNEGALEWFQEAITTETHRFLQQYLMETMACFRIDPLPSFIRELITARHDISSDDNDSRELARRISAIRVARSASTREAFEALLDFGLTYDGGVIRHNSDALGDVAVTLAELDAGRVLAELVSKLDMKEAERHRIAAAFALEKVAAMHGEDVDAHTRALINYSYDERRKPYERSSIIGGLAWTEKWVPQEEYITDLKMWATKPDRWVGGASLELLARKGLLVKSSDLLEKSIGLTSDGGQWDLAEEENRHEWSGYFIGLLFNQHPEQFESALISVIASGDLGSVYQAITWVQKHYADAGKPPSPGIVRALVMRIRTGQSRHSAELDLFEVLRDLSPAALNGETWEDIWNDWLPDARVALAKTLGVRHPGNNLSHRQLGLLQQLAGDGHYAVRRAAYRGLRISFPEALRGLALSWSEEDSLEMNKRAAEAWGWAAGFDRQSGVAESDELFDRLIAHPESEVRDGFGRGFNDGRRQAWASSHMMKVKEVDGAEAKDILKAWAFGDALAAIGDDTVVDRLRSHLVKSSCPPHARYWLGRIIESTMKNWRKQTKKWPDPWFAWTGGIETGSGIVKLRGGDAAEVVYSVWKRPAEAPQDIHAWGGAFWLVPFLVPISGEGSLELEDERIGRIVLNDVRENIATFLGKGPYPSLDG